MASQKQMCAKRKNVIYLKIYLHAPKTNFLSQNRIDSSEPAKLPDKLAAVKDS